MKIFRAKLFFLSTNHFRYILLENYTAAAAAAEHLSFSPTFYEQLFCTKVFWAAFLYLGLRFVFFCWKEIGAKASCKMLVKLTTAADSMLWIRLCLHNSLWPEKKQKRKTFNFFWGKKTFILFLSHVLLFTHTQTHLDTLSHIQIHKHTNTHTQSLSYSDTHNIEREYLKITLGRI